LAIEITRCFVGEVEFWEMMFYFDIDNDIICEGRRKNVSLEMWSKSERGINFENRGKGDNLRIERSVLVMEDFSGWRLEYKSEEMAENTFQVVKKIEQSGSEMVLITDIDETINNSVRKHEDIYKRYFKRLQRILHKKAENEYEERVQRDYGYLRGLENPTYEEIILAGGTHKAYKDFGEAYKKINNQVVMNHNFHQNLDLVEPDVAWQIRQINQEFSLVGVLTSRPQLVREVTRQQLLKDVGLDLPVIMRSEETVLEQAADWKIFILNVLATISGKKIVMLDDQRGLIELIEKQNNPRVKGILMRGVGFSAEGVSWGQLRGQLRELLRE
jgi:hypothetical protein